MSKRVYITLPDGVYLKLEQLAKKQGRLIANLASYLVQRGVEELQKL